MGKSVPHIFPKKPVKLRKIWSVRFEDEGDAASVAPAKFANTCPMILISFCQISKVFKKENFFVSVVGGRNFRLMSEEKLIFKRECHFTTL